MIKTVRAYLYCVYIYEWALGTLLHRLPMYKWWSSWSSQDTTQDSASASHWPFHFYLFSFSLGARRNNGYCLVFVVRNSMPLHTHCPVFIKIVWCGDRCVARFTAWASEPSWIQTMHTNHAKPHHSLAMPYDCYESHDAERSMRHTKETTDSILRALCTQFPQLSRSTTLTLFSVPMRSRIELFRFRFRLSIDGSCVSWTHIQYSLN